VNVSDRATCRCGPVFVNVMVESTVYGGNNGSFIAGCLVLTRAARTCGTAPYLNRARYDASAIAR